MASSQILSGALMEQLHNLLLRAFKESEMLFFLRFRMDEEYDSISSPLKNKRERFYEVIEWAEYKGRLLELVQKAADYRPDDPDLGALTTQIESELAADPAGSPETTSSAAGHNTPGSFPYAEIRDALIQCAPLSNDRTLRALFVDDRLYPWRNAVPGGNSVQERAEALIDMLRDQENTAGKNGLRLFLEVAADRLSPQVACHGRLLVLARQL